jgi:hypothetical protein
MSTNADHELLSFHHFVAQQLDSGEQLSPEEALDTWRMLHPSLGQYAEDVQALREALTDMKAGDVGTPLEIFKSDFRKRHKLGCDP